MAETGDATPFLPDSTSLAALRDAVQGCRGCDLWEPATQAVFGEGPRRARVMLVGEQPGDREDREGHPFVGPAGRELDEALRDAELERSEVYLTNVVKHFRFEERGKRRLHKSPDVAHVRACLPWLTAEVAAVAPRVVVAMGATAGRAVLGRPVRVTAERGRVLDVDDAPRVVLTTHPSALLRLRERAEREAAFAAFVDDLRLASDAAGVR